MCPTDCIVPERTLTTKHRRQLSAAELPPSAAPFYVITAFIRLYLWVKASLPPSITRHISSRMEGS